MVIADTTIGTEETLVRPTPAPAADAPLTPGTIVAHRYRISHLIAQGGTADVYRADDLKLGQPVALKFLSRSMLNVPGALQRLCRETRLGRQVSHPNVCRLYDIVESGDRHFLTMEYVDGEDLRSLLTRVGRLPYEKALLISRDLCSALATAHELGIIHRDLKPGNVMINDRGMAKITDFGLAAIGTDLGTSDRSGTPAYMSPEQLMGGELSERSDIYALGLLLYELFTGVHVFEARTMTELFDAHLRPKTPPTAYVPDLDPSISAAILACIEENPLDRPPSARHVLVRLPGTDALEAAVERGETPSPELVAAASIVGTLPPLHAWAGAAVAALLAVLLVFAAPYTMFYAMVPAIRPPEVLAEYAAQAQAALLGPASAGLRHYAWMQRDEAAMRRISLSDGSRDAWTRLRTSPDGIEYVMYAVRPEFVPLNPTGRLQYESADLLQSLPRVVLNGEGKVKTVSQEVDGSLRNSSYMGELGLSQEYGGGAFLLAVFLATALSLNIARRNIHAGRVDRSGAQKVVAYVLSVRILAWACGADHADTPGAEWIMVVTGMSRALFDAMMVWLLYVALEPLLRRRWPRMLVGWNRLLLGRLRDPLVGRDLLAGVIIGLAWETWWRLINVSPSLFGLQPLVPLGDRLDALFSLRGAFFQFFSLQYTAVLFAVGSAFILLIWNVAFRRRRLAMFGAAITYTVIAYPTMTFWRPEHAWFVLLFALVVGAMMVTILTRLGVLTLGVAIFVHFELAAFPLTADLSAWYAGRSAVALALLLGLAVYGANVCAARSFPVAFREGAPA